MDLRMVYADRYGDKVQEKWCLKADSYNASNYLFMIGFKNCL